MSVFNFQMHLDPNEVVDAKLFFHPNVVDINEIRFLRRVLRPGDTFLDLGSNIGFYSLVAASCVEKEGLVVAVEADPFTHAKLDRNVEISQFENVKTIHMGLSDKEETLPLLVNTQGHRGGNSFIATATGITGEVVAVKCKPLRQLLEETGVERVRMAKVDIEGFESRVLEPFFQTASKSLWPEFLLIEINHKTYPEDATRVLELLEENGYRKIGHPSSLNYIFSR